MDPIDFLMPSPPQLINKRAHIDPISPPTFPDNLEVTINGTIHKEKLKPLRTKKKSTSKYIIGTIEIIALSIVSLLIIQNLNTKKQSKELLEITDSQKKHRITINTSDSEKNTLEVLSKTGTLPNQVLALPPPLQNNPDEKELQSEVIENLRKQVKQINSTLTLIQNKITSLEKKKQTHQQQRT